MQLQGETFRQLEGRLTQRIMLGNQHYFIKQHFGIGWKEVFKNLFQFRLPVVSAKNEWIAIEKLSSLHILTPKLSAYGKRGINPAKQQSFVLMEELAPVVSLETLCATWPCTPPSFSLKCMLLEEVARITRIMHENGVNHRDLYLCHFLLDISHNRETLSPQQLKLYLIDLHRAQSRRVTPKRWLIKDLAGLYFSSKDIGLTARDWYRFIKAYRQCSLRKVLSRENNFWIRVKERGEQLYRDHTK